MTIHKGTYIKMDIYRGSRLPNVMKGREHLQTLERGKRVPHIRKGRLLNPDILNTGNGGGGGVIKTPRQEPLEIAWKRSLFE